MCFLDAANYTAAACGAGRAPVRGRSACAKILGRRRWFRRCNGFPAAGGQQKASAIECEARYPEAINGNKRKDWAVDVYAMLPHVAWACFHGAAITDTIKIRLISATLQSFLRTELKAETTLRGMAEVIRFAGFRNDLPRWPGFQSTR